MAVKFGGAKRASAAGSPAAPLKKVVDLPEPTELDPTLAMPCILLQGRSGTGKTHAIAKLLEAGKTGIVLAVEPKMQSLAKYRCPVVFVGAPVKEQDGSLRAATTEEKYDRLFQFKEQLAAGKYREHKGKPVDFLATDGFLEVGQVIYDYWKNKRITSKAGESNTFALWDNVAEKSVDFFQGMRDAAGLASDLFGFAPIGMVATIGEHIEKTKFGEVRYEPLFPGRKAPELLPYQFEQVIRLSARVEDDVYTFIAHTCGSEEWEAKTPTGLFPPEIHNPNFNEIWDKIVQNYRDEGAGS